MENCPFDDKPCSNPKIMQVWKIIPGGSHPCDACQQCAFNQVKKYHQEPISDSDVVCMMCGCRIGDMQAMNRFGCPHCYVAHRNFAQEMFAKCQNSSKHVGKIPVAWQKRHFSSNIKAQIQMLEEKIRSAVEVENYEVAAILKKKIEQLQQGGSNAQ